MDDSLRHLCPGCPGEYFTGVMSLSNDNAVRKSVLYPFKYVLSDFNWPESDEDNKGASDTDEEEKEEEEEEKEKEMHEEEFQCDLRRLKIEVRGVGGGGGG